MLRLSPFWPKKIWTSPHLEGLEPGTMANATAVATRSSHVRMRERVTWEVDFRWDQMACMRHERGWMTWWKNMKMKKIEWQPWLSRKEEKEKRNMKCAIWWRLSKHEPCLKIFSSRPISFFCLESQWLMAVVAESSSWGLTECLFPECSVNFGSLTCLDSPAIGIVQFFDNSFKVSPPMYHGYTLSWSICQPPAQLRSDSLPATPQISAVDAFVLLFLVSSRQETKFWESTRRACLIEGNVSCGKSDWRVSCPIRIIQPSRSIFTWSFRGSVLCNFIPHPANQSNAVYSWTIVHGEAGIPVSIHTYS